MTRANDEPPAVDVIVGDLDELARILAARLARAAEHAHAERGRFALALSGGSLAEQLFPRLARSGFDAARTDFFWADERAVAPTSPDSNFGLAERLWLGPAGVPPVRVHRMPAEAPDLGRAAFDYEAELERVTGAPARLDAVLLGVGPDGHVASLFPGAAALAVDRPTVLAIEDSPKPPPRRLTLSLPLLAEARRVVVAAFGDAKAAVIAAAFATGRSELPLARLLRRAHRPLLLLDPAAASRLAGDAARLGSGS
jgi:6-phosphogluconolactonase